jgi:AcrR family transcriptional regulator
LATRPNLRTQRADARRNRARILEVAVDAFAREGPEVSIQEIARRAGVSTGTVSRHFPAKNDLFSAIVLDRIQRLVSAARTLAATEPPGPAFYRYIEVMALEGAENRAIVSALAGVGFDVQVAAKGTDEDVMGAWSALLSSAQAAGQVRADVTFEDVKALVIACCAPRHDPDSTRSATLRLLSVVRAGLQPAAPA